MPTKLWLSCKQPFINFKITAIGFALVFGAVYVVMPQAHAAQDRWLKLEPESPILEEYVMLDRESITAEEGSPHLKNASFYTNSLLSFGNEPQSVRIDLHLNCSEKTFSVRKTAFFSEPDLKGRLVEETEMPTNSQPLDFKLGPDKLLYKTICK